MAFNLDQYETVEVRLERFWEKYPTGRIHTAVLEKTDTSILILSSIYAERNDMNPIATGIAEEIKSNSGVNRDAWVENCETSAIGRALANGGFAAKGTKRPSREEMEKVQRRADEPVKTYSPELVALATTALEQIKDIETIEELKFFYDGALEAKLLDVPVNGTNVMKAISARKKELENA
jgi:hypothetical protein